MEKRDVVETVYGKTSKYEVIKESGGVFSGPKFHVLKDGKVFKSGYTSLADAVEVAKKQK